MRRSSDRRLLGTYLRRHNLDSIFETDLSGFMTVMQYDAGETVCEVEEKLDHFLFLVQGRMKISGRSENAKGVLLRFYEPLSVIGDLEFIDDYRVETEVEAVTDVALIGIRMELLRQHAWQDATFLRFLLSHLGSKLFDLTRATTRNLSYPLENRLAFHLQDLLKSAYSLCNPITVDPSELADLLGVTRRHVNRVMRGLVDKGVLERAGAAIAVKDPAALARLAARMGE